MENFDEVFEFLNEKVDVEKNLSEMEDWLDKNGFESVYCPGTYSDIYMYGLKEISKLHMAQLTLY